MLRLPFAELLDALKASMGIVTGDVSDVKREYSQLVLLV